jgi:hypothetical protein
MKRIICKFANWLLRRCTDPMIAFGGEIYINGKTYKLVRATREITSYFLDTITFEVRDE